jgi:hypothetical protein
VQWSTSIERIWWETAGKNHRADFARSLLVAVVR